MGRDRRHEFPARTRRLAPTFTEDEFAAIRHAAIRAGLTPTGFCGSATLAAANDEPLVHDSRSESLAGVQAELAAVRTSVVRVGTNLNQAVAAFHATGDVPDWLRHAVDRCSHALAAVDATASRTHGLLS